MQEMGSSKSQWNTQEYTGNEQKQQDSSGRIL